LEASKIKEVIKMVRYTEKTCEAYCINAALNSDEPDLVVLVAQEKAGIAEAISEIRKKRWEYVSVALKDKHPEIIITDSIEFEFNIEQEADQMKRLGELIAILNKLNPLFDEIANKFPYLSQPTLKGLEILRTSSISQISKYVTRIKNEVAFRTGLASSKGKTLDQVLEDVNFKKCKAENEGYIKAEEAKLKEINYYISQVKNILGE
jgi:hypothetical protein